MELKFLKITSDMRLKFLGFFNFINSFMKSFIQKPNLLPGYAFGPFNYSCCE